MPMAQGQALDVVSPEKPVDHKTDRIEFGKGCQTTIRNCIKHHQTTLHERFLDDCIRTWSLPERARKDVVDLNQSCTKRSKKLRNTPSFAPVSPAQETSTRQVRTEIQVIQKIEIQLHDCKVCASALAPSCGSWNN